MSELGRECGAVHWGAILFGILRKGVSIESYNSGIAYENINCKVANGFYP